MVAIKRIDQSLLIQVDKVGSAHREKQILIEVSDLVFTINLLKTFKDDEHLYFVFEHCPFGMISELAEGFPEKKLPLQITTYYAAQLVLFLEGLHKKGIVHRDLKPENILIAQNMHLRVIDFGDSCYLDDQKN